MNMVTGTTVFNLNLNKLQATKFHFILCFINENINLVQFSTCFIRLSHNEFDEVNSLTMILQRRKKTILIWFCKFNYLFAQQNAHRISKSDCDLREFKVIF